MPAERMRLYELMFVISPEADDDGVAAAVQRTVDHVTDRGGSITEQEKWGLRRFAYPIKGFQEGHYVLLRFALGSSHDKELERTLIAAEDVLRHLITTVERLVDPEAMQAEAEAAAKAEAEAAAKTEAEAAAKTEATAEPEPAEAEAEVPEQTG